MPSFFNRLLCNFPAGLLATGAFISAALAQGAPEGGKPMQFSVRPSGSEAALANEALERQQKLLKRLEQSDHMIRSICINCGDGWKHQIYAPFDPHTVLGGSRGTPDVSPETQEN